MENVILSCDDCLRDREHCLSTGECKILVARHLLKIMMEKCTDHPIGDYGHDCKSEFIEFIDNQVADYEHWYYAHRKDCLHCMKEIQRQVNG
jgi:hypothetical protein